MLAEGTSCNPLPCGCCLLRATFGTSLVGQDLTPSLEAFKAGWSLEQRSLVGGVPHGRGLEQNGLLGPLQHKPLCDSY